MTEPANVEADHRRLGVDTFNHVWTLLGRERLTPDEHDELLHEAHASAYHWLKAPECTPENRARSEWLCSRVYALLGRAEPALHHARRCLAVCEQHAIGGFDVAYAYEALARASRVAGDDEHAVAYVEQARAAGELIADPEDKELFESDIADVA